MVGRSSLRLFLTGWVLLAVLLNVNPSGLQGFGHCEDAAVSSVDTRATQSSILVPTAVARVGWIDSRDWETTETGPDHWVCDQDRLRESNGKDRLTRLSFEIASHHTLMDLNVRLQI